MYCPNCGKELQKNTKFCGNCGFGIEEIATTTSQKMWKKSKNYVSSWPRNRKILVVSIIIIVCAVSLFLGIGSTVSSPSYLAKKALTSIVNGDYGTYYDLLQLEENPFVTKEKYVNYLKEELADETHTITDITILTREEYIARIGFDSIFFDDGRIPQESADLEIVYLSYQLDGKEGETYLSFTKDEGHSYLFFPEWRLVDEETLVKDYTLYAPKDSTVMFDDISLNQEERISSSNNHYDCYQIPLVIAKDTPLTFTLSSGLILEDHITPSDQSYYPSEVTVSENHVKSLEEASQKAIQLLFDGAQGNITLDTLEADPLFQAYDDTYHTLEKIYHNLDTTYPYRYYKITNLTLGEVKRNPNEKIQYHNEDGSISIQLYFQYQYDRENTVTKETMKRNQQEPVTITYLYQDHQFIVKSFNTTFSFLFN